MFFTDTDDAIVQEALYQSAVNQPYEHKVQQAIDLLRTMATSDGYLVRFSGGKDSIVVADLCRQAGVPHSLHYSNVTIDPPELVWFIKRHYPETVWHSVGIPLPLYMARKSNGPPTRRARWCCEIYKEAGVSDLQGVVVLGVRGEESHRRKGLWRQVAPLPDGKRAVCPVLYWTESDIWRYIRERGLPYCSLYDEGFKRLGCIGCPLSGPEQQKREFERWPAYEKLWKKGFEAYWKSWKGVPRQRPNKNGSYDRWIEKFNTVEELWSWWMQEKSTDDKNEADCQLNLW